MAARRSRLDVKSGQPKVSSQPASEKKKQESSHALLRRMNSARRVRLPISLLADQPDSFPKV